ncbi:MAG TPA: IPT/TIG domain-containing protein [Solirubrobacterales bacterium]
MKLLSRSLLGAAVMAAALSFCSAAGAANVTVGPSLTGSWEPFECGALTCTYVNDELAGTGANLTSPVTGAVVSFSVVDGSTAGTYRLRTANQVSGTLGFIMRKLSAPVAAVPNAGIQAYATSLPIGAGQTIGLTTSETASVGFREVGRYAEWETEPPESGQSLAEISLPEIAGFNAEIQPAPTITGLSVTSGPTAGGTGVSIAGTDLEGATAVSFGGTSAAVTSDSETQITAVAPANASATAVPVSVTTVAGTATGPSFTYVAPPAPPVVVPPTPHCVVPKLSGKNLKAAKAALVKAQCKLGTVKKLSGATPKTGKVAQQGSKAGSQFAVGTKVAVTLKPGKPAGKKRRRH